MVPDQKDEGMIGEILADSRIDREITATTAAASETQLVSYQARSAKTRTSSGPERARCLLIFYILFIN